MALNINDLSPKELRQLTRLWSEHQREESWQRPNRIRAKIREAAQDLLDAQTDTEEMKIIQKLTKLGKKLDEANKNLDWGD